MQKKFKTNVFWISVLVAWVFDLLFWQKNVGISYLILVVLVMITGYGLARFAGIKPARVTWLLVPLILFFAAMTLFRSDPLTVVVNVGYSIGLLALAAMTFRGGKWLQYSFLDYIVQGFYLIISSLSRLLTQNGPSPAAESVDAEAELPDTPANARRKINMAVVRGIILALPIVLVMASLLASADPVFAKDLNHLFDWFDIEKIGEYLFRLFYILILAYLLAGTYLHAFFQSLDEKLISLEKSQISRLIGRIESAIILGSIDALFAVFVFIQFRYFFGGQGNIHIEGYTYAEYARKGFNEMIIVAMLSLLLLQVLSAITRRESKTDANLFSGLSVGLVGLVLVILVSAFQRLQLYEMAYGFSRIRLYSHIFMIWLGILLAATVVIEIVQRQRAFALATLLAALGFGVTLNAINADRFITEQNIRIAAARPLDVPYLVSLSYNNVQYLSEIYQTSAPDSDLHDKVGVTLACKIHKSGLSWETDPDDAKDQETFWGAYIYSRAESDRILGGLQPELDQKYPIKWDEDMYSNYGTLSSGKVYCIDTSYRD